MGEKQSVCDGCPLRGEDFYTGADVCKGVSQPDGRCATRDAHQIEQLEVDLAEALTKIAELEVEIAQHETAQLDDGA